LKKMQDDIKARGMEEIVSVVPTGCTGPCNQGPLVRYLPENTIYQKVNTESVVALNQAQLVDKKIIFSSLIFADSRPTPFINAAEDPFFLQQFKIALKDCGN
jgi:(2Fe-2S) ferredoxin